MVPSTANLAAPHCRVLPPGECNSTIPMPLPVYTGRFITIDATVFSYCLQS